MTTTLIPVVTTDGYFPIETESSYFQVMDTDHNVLQVGQRRALGSFIDVEQKITVDRSCRVISDTNTVICQTDSSLIEARFLSKLFA